MQAVSAIVTLLSFLFPITKFVAIVRYLSSGALSCDKQLRARPSRHCHWLLRFLSRKSARAALRTVGTFWQLISFRKCNQRWVLCIEALLPTT